LSTSPLCGKNEKITTYHGCFLKYLVGGFLMQSIKSVLITLITTILVLALGTSTALNYFHAKKVILNDLEQSLSSTSKAAANEMGLWIELRKTEMETLANSPILASNNKDAINAYLAAENKRLSVFSIFWVADEKGNWYSPTGTSGSIRERSYFGELMDTGKTVVSDPLVGKADGKLAFVVAVPIKVDGKIIGILGGNVKMDELVRQAGTVKIGQTGFASIIQQDGLVVAHPNQDYVMKYNPSQDSQMNPNLREVYQRAIKGEPGLTHYNNGNEDEYFAYTPIAGVKWILFTTAITNEFTRHLITMAWSSVLTAVVILGIAIFLISVVARKITRPLQQLQQVAKQVAQGDFTISSIKVSDRDNEIGHLAKAFETMITSIRILVSEVRGATDQVAASSEELTASSERSAQAANQIAASIGAVANGANEQLAAANETSAVVEQMSAGIQQVATNTNQVAEQSAQAADKAKEGDKVVEKAVSQMAHVEDTVNTSAKVVAKLGDRSKEIGQIVDTISEIAGQTNLLALNAAVEAARAGEQGRGFAVVAEEVRKLAEQSQEAAKKIAELIGEIQGDTDKAVVAMNNGTREAKTGAEVVNAAGVAFREIVELVTQVSSQVREISAAIQQMASGSQQIVGSVRKIDTLSKKSAGEAHSVSAATEEQLASMEEIATSSQSLAKLAQDLQAAVGKFRV
jgi:methyl-accepting chemotaxis protein